MPSPSPEAQRVAERYRIALADAPRRGASGERLGRGTGSSLEFQDRRAYVAGDDLRHLDWRAFARTDQLMVRLYREEVQPRVEVLVDASRSMAVAPEKARLVVDLALVLLLAARAGGLAARVIVLGERALPIEQERLEREGLELAGRAPLMGTLGEALPLLRAGSLRFLLSDFLTPHDAAALVRPLAASAGGLCLVQVLAPADADPPLGEALRLADAESDEMLDLVLDARSVALYRERLARLSAGLQTECRRAGALFVPLVAGPPLEQVCRAELAARGVLEPA